METNLKSVRKRRKPVHFVPDEDEIIKRMRILGKDWKTIGCELKRTPASCRERYNFYLQPDRIIGLPSNEELENLKSLIQGDIGKQWAKLVKYFPGRNEIDLKKLVEKLYFGGEAN